VPAVETVQVEMPAMGESVTEGTVLDWLKEEGDRVEEGESLVEVSTDKIDAEVPSPAAGTLTKILKGPDEVVKIGEALAELEPGGNGTGDGSGAAPSMTKTAGEGDADIGDDADAATLQSEYQGEEATGSGDGAAGESVDLVMPEMGESVTEGTVLEWLKQPGDEVAEGDPVVEVSTDKIDAEVPSPVSGKLLEALVEPDEVVEVGQVLARLQAGPSVAPVDRGPRTEDRSAASGGAVTAAAGDGGKASPVARRIAASEGVDLSAVTGSGAGGRIMKADVIAAAESGNGAAAPAAAAAGEAKVLRGPAGMLAKAMEESRSIPTATSFRTLAVDTLDAKRKALNGALSERGMKVSFTHLIAWAIVEAGREWPAMARSFEMRDGKPNVVDHGAVNLGIAVDVEKKDGSRALMVPCIPAADSTDFKSFHAKYEELVRKTRENALTADDFVGTNITLTNPGGLGTVASVPRLMTGQGTIVATGSIAYPPEWSHSPADRLKTLGVSKVMTMTSTYDHRIIQGAESGSFLRRIEELLGGADEFYEGVARALDVDSATVTKAHPASASAPPLVAGSTTTTPPSAVQATPDEELMQAVQAATSLLKA
jgi:2-oxoglutarate dehydrogenase E1 component